MKKLTPVLQGTLIVLPCTEKDKSVGGFNRKPAPTNGIAWETETDAGFIPKDEWAAKLTDLRLLERSATRSDTFTEGNP